MTESLRTLCLSDILTKPRFAAKSLKTIVTLPRFSGLAKSALNIAAQMADAGHAFPRVEELVPGMLVFCWWWENRYLTIALNSSTLMYIIGDDRYQTSAREADSAFFSLIVPFLSRFLNGEVYYG